jgi:hypothetical protein
MKTFLEWTHSKFQEIFNTPSFYLTQRRREVAEFRREFLKTASPFIKQAYWAAEIKKNFFRMISLFLFKSGIHDSPLWFSVFSAPLRFKNFDNLITLW